MRWLLGIFRRDFWVQPDPAEAGPVTPGDDTPEPAYTQCVVEGKCPACGIWVPSWLKHHCPEGRT